MQRGFRAAETEEGKHGFVIDYRCVEVPVVTLRYLIGNTAMEDEN